jgi:heme O synthase-like polyprenyltransferase
MHKILRRFLNIAAGGLSGVTLFGIGQYLITGYTDIEHLIRFTVFT